jgi:hypothetical protein
MKKQTTFWTPPQGSTLLTAESFQASADRIRGTIKVAPSKKSKVNKTKAICIAGVLFAGIVALDIVVKYSSTTPSSTHSTTLTTAQLEERTRLGLDASSSVNEKAESTVKKSSVVQCEVLPGQVVEKQSQEACDKDKEFMGNLSGTLENLKALQDDQLRN